VVSGRAVPAERAVERAIQRATIERAAAVARSTAAAAAVSVVSAVAVVSAVFVGLVAGIAFQAVAFAAVLVWILA
jgi:hypothetical protein